MTGARLVGRSGGLVGVAEREEEEGEEEEGNESGVRASAPLLSSTARPVARRRPRAQAKKGGFFGGRTDAGGALDGSWRRVRRLTSPSAREAVRAGRPDGAEATLTPSSTPSRPRSSPRVAPKTYFAKNDSRAPPMAPLRAPHPSPAPAPETINQGSAESRPAGTYERGGGVGPNDCQRGWPGDAPTGGTPRGAPLEARLVRPDPRGVPCQKKYLFFRRVERAVGPAVATENRTRVAAGLFISELQFAGRVSRKRSLIGSGGIGHVATRLHSLGVPQCRVITTRPLPRKGTAIGGIKGFKLLE